jgi:flagellar protein FlgJ
MVADFQAAQNYTDLGGLAALKAGARERSPEALRETARQFEALFLQMMLQSMREAAGSIGGEDKLLDNDQVQLYQEMYDKQIGLKLAQGGGIGLADVIYRQLGGETAGADKAPGMTTTDARAVPARTAMPGFAQRLAVLGAARPAATDWQPPDAQQFVADIWPHAQRAAQALGVAPEVLVAQAALESGWGRHQIRHADGAPSFNLFGIKADGRWAGERVGVSTLEYVDGVAERQRAEFRSYASLGEAFDDYVRFIQDNPRYGEALSRAADARGYVEGLARAGYATDPGYAEKILGILERPEFAARVAAVTDTPLKSAGQPPLS